MYVVIHYSGSIYYIVISCNTYYLLQVNYAAKLTVYEKRHFSTSRGDIFDSYFHIQGRISGTEAIGRSPPPSNSLAVIKVIFCNFFSFIHYYVPCDTSIVFTISSRKTYFFQLRILVFPNFHYNFYRNGFEVPELLSVAPWKTLDLSFFIKIKKILTNLGVCKHIIQHIKKNH